MLKFMKQNLLLKKLSIKLVINTCYFTIKLKNEMFIFLIPEISIINKTQIIVLNMNPIL